MKKSLFLLVILMLTVVIFISTANAQITVSGSSTNGDYTSLTKYDGAFNAINNRDQAGNNIVITITGNVTDEDGTMALTGSNGMWTTLTIKPSGARTISGATVRPIIDLNGAKYVSIDGLNTDGNSLTISNTSTTNFVGLSTIRFINDATNNTLKNCTIKGSSISPTGGILLFSTTTGYYGNNNNTIDNNHITSAADANRPLSAIYSLGTDGKQNRGNIISNNNFYNFLNRGTDSYGINLGDFTTSWTISGNSFYETASYAPTASVNYRVISISNFSGGDFTISNNFIGGSSASCGGSAWTKTKGVSPYYGNTFYGIYLGVGTDYASNIQGNTIRNFSYLNGGATDWYGIYVSGKVNVGTTEANVIGAASGTGSITITNSTTGSSFFGVKIATGTIDVQYNMIGSITVTNVATSSTNFYGILKNAVSGTTTISNNTIGSTETAGSINASSASTLQNQVVCGIKSYGSGSVVISGNTIANMVNGTTNASLASSGIINGIAVTAGRNTITNNIISDLTIANANIASDINASVLGISLISSLSANHIVSGNTIYNISNTSSSFGGSVIGLYYAGNVSESNVSKNFIHSLSVTGATSTAASIYGIKINSGVCNYFNNIISLGGNTQTTLYGIYETGVAGNNNNLYFNTVYVGGSLASGAVNKSYALYSAVNTNTRNFRNNIFSNVRSTTEGSVLHYAMYLVAAGGTLSCDYNDYQASGTGGILGYYEVDKAILPIVTGKDINSVSTDPSFAYAGGTSATNYIPLPPVSLPGVTINTYTTDYAGRTRAASPTMGALESVAPVAVTATEGTASGSYTTLKAAFDKINDGTHQGSITIKLNGNTSAAGITETASAMLNASLAPASYTSVNIYPTITGIIITGNLDAPLIDLDGADNVTIDGRVNATGSTNDLIISNTSTAQTSGTSTIRFINDACSNTVQYSSVKGSGRGVILFRTTTGSTGNDNNTIDHCNITSSTDANRPVNAVYAFGTSGMENSGNIISNNNFYNFMRTADYSNGILLYLNNTAWTISGNSFYETSTFVPTADYGVYYMIFIQNDGSNYSVTGNYIGGTAPLCAGTAFTKSSSPQYDNIFGGIYLYTASGTASNVQGNTISNMSWTNSGAAAWRGIKTANAGDINIGTTEANTIGDSTGNASIFYTCGATGANFYGMDLANTGTTVVHDNIIGSVTASNAAANATNIYGIYKTGAGTTTISNNTVGSTTTSNSINTTSASSAAGNAQVVYGIYSAGSGSVSISSNTVSKLTNGTTNSVISTAGLVNGIATTDGINTISNNTVRDLTIANANYMNDHRATVTGISQTSTSGDQKVSGNVIYNLTNTYATPWGLVEGIYYSGDSAGTNVISGNFIQSLSFTHPNTNAMVYGMQCTQSSATFSNNIISLGNNLNTDITIDGIHESCDETYNTNFYFNTVYLYGNAGTGGNYTTAFYSNRATNLKNIRNNIFVNNRTGTTANRQSAIRLWGATGLTIDYNDYYAPNTGGVLGQIGSPAANYSTLSAWQVFTGQDTHSLNINSLFLNPEAGIASGFKPQTALLIGTDGTGIITDYIGAPRQIVPTMGALEASVIFYVDAAQTNDLGDGCSWATAKKTLQAAMDISQSGDRIWVKAGTYKPTSAYDLTNTSRFYHFRLKNGVTVYGGFAGTEATDYDLTLRDFNTNKSILSGDLDGDDDYTGNFTGISDNCYHIIYQPEELPAINTTAVLDGFTIQGGNASGGAPHSDGGGIYVKSGDPAFNNCTIIHNKASRNGAGFTSTTSNSKFTNCYIINNIGSYGGGGTIASGSIVFNNCLIANNTGNIGGGLYYLGNEGSPEFINTTIANNNAASRAGGIYFAGTSMTLQLKNSIVWGNTVNNNPADCGNQFYITMGTIVLNYSCYYNGPEYLYQGTNIFTATNHNITTDPTFVNPAVSDYRICGTSPCTDVGNDTYNTIANDIRGTGFLRKRLKTSPTLTGTIDMGPFEYKYAADPAAPAPSLTTTAITAITANTASSGGETIDDMGETITAKGVVWDIATSPTIALTTKTSETVSTGSEDADFSSAVTGLIVNTRYYLRAYASNILGTGYGDELDFYTLANTPSVPSLSAPTTTTLNVAINANGNPAATTYAIFDTVTSKFVQANGTLGLTTIWQTEALWEVNATNTAKTISGLSENVKYAFKVKAKNGSDVETDYSSKDSLYTLAKVPTAPTVNTATTTSVNVAINGNANPAATEFAIQETVGSQYLQSDGTLGVSAVWQTEADWETDATNTAKTVTELSVNTQYTFKVKARNGNNVETVFSGTTSLYTLANVPDAPTVNNPAATTLNIAVNVNSNPVATVFAIQDSVNGTFVQANGTRSATAVWQTAIIWGTKTVTGLSTGVTYYFRVKARNGSEVETIFSFTTAQNTCSNPTNAGEINGAQTICYNTEAAGLGSVSGASDYGGTLEYQWQSNTTSSTFTFDDIIGAATNTYSPGAMTQTSWFRRLARVSCKDDWTGAAESNVVKITVDPLPEATASGSTTICVNSDATVSGASSSNGDIEWTSDGSGSITDETSLSPTYTPAAEDAGNSVILTMTVTSDNTCGTATATATYTVYVDPSTVAGTISGSESIIVHTTTGDLSLSGQTGDVLQWEKKMNDGEWEIIGTVTATTYSETPVTVGEWSYRALVQSGVCDSDYTEAHIIDVIPAEPDYFTLTAPTGPTYTGSPSGNFVVALYDEYDNPTYCRANTTFNLSTNSTSSSHSFNPASPLVMTVNTYSSTFTYTDTKVGTHNITAGYVSGSAGLAGETLTVPITIILPEPWVHANIGASSGTTEFFPEINAGTFQMTAKGLSTPTSDVMNYVYQPLCGTGTVIARLDDSQNGGWAGVMMRESNAAGSKAVLFKTKLYNPSVIIGYRANTNAKMVNLSQMIPSIHWMKIQRNGNTFQIFTSYNGITWNRRYTATVVMPNCIEAGIFTESIQASRTVTSWFDHVEVAGYLKSEEEGNVMADSRDAFEIEFYPNPANDQITIMAPENDRTIKVTLINANGSVVETNDFNTMDAIYNLQHIKPGVYLLRFERDGLIVNKQLIVM